jgi:hypothetical protein
MPPKTLLEKIEAITGSIVKHDYDLVVWSREEGKLTLRVTDLRDLLKFPQFKKVTLEDLHKALPEPEKRTRSKAKTEQEEEANA